jgi:hypothetical protein
MFSICMFVSMSSLQADVGRRVQKSDLFHRQRYTLYLGWALHFIYLFRLLEATMLYFLYARHLTTMII